MIVYAPRASSILYNYLVEGKFKGYWLLPVNICPIVPITFLKAGVSFEFVDINMEDYCIDYASVIEHISNRSCQGLLFVYTYGINVDRNLFFHDLKRIRSNFKIIEDKCLNIPSFDLGSVSEYSEFALYSTGYSKYCDLGYGGFAVGLNNFKYSVNRVNYLKEDSEKLESYYKKVLKEGFKFKLKDNCEWLDNSSFRYTPAEYQNSLEDKINYTHIHKKRLNEIYENNLPDHIKLKVDDAKTDTWRYNVMVDRKSELLKQIFNNDLFASSHYQPLNLSFGKSERKYQVGSFLRERVINLFNDLNFNEKMAEAVCKIINRHVNFTK